MSSTFPSYLGEPVTRLQYSGIDVPSFVKPGDDLDKATVLSFGEEWNKFSAFSPEEIAQIGKEYFDIVPCDVLDGKAYVLDAGCGSGRFSKYLSPLVDRIEAVDPSASVEAAARLLSPCPNVRITQAAIDSLPFPDDIFDFAICLGVMHHIPDTESALRRIVRKLKPGGNILIYLYYDLDGRGFLFRAAFAGVNILREVICRLPRPIKHFLSDLIALGVYLPLVSLSRALALIPGAAGAAERVPLSYYRDKTFRVIRNDALDRFGTPLEKRFSKAQVKSLLGGCGIDAVIFSDSMPRWRAFGRKRTVQ